MKLYLTTAYRQSVARRLFVLNLLLLMVTPSFAQDRADLQKQVRTEFLHAWNGYKKYAWNHDDLKPLSKTYHDWYAEPLLMTPVDALDTMIIMGLKAEADKNARAHRPEPLVRQEH
jgi:hypothetical protein